MKKLLKIVSFSLLLTIILVSSFGCSCSKSLNMKINIVFSNEDESATKMVDIRSKVFVYKKFREPADTACYEKIENQLVLIEDAEGVSSCYDSEGNKFEKATFKNTDKTQISSNFFNVREEYEKMSENKNVIQSIFNQEIPDENSLLFEIEFESYETDDVYLRDFNVYDIFGDIVKEESMNKIVMKYPDSYQLDDKVYYKIPKVSFFGSTNTIKFVIEIKGLNKDDLKVDEKDITLDIPVIIKY